MDDYTVEDSGVLFDMDPVPAGQPAPKLSATRRQTQLQTERLAARVHPLAGVAGRHLGLHPDAPVGTDPGAPGARCGTCWYRKVLPYHRRSYPKCLFPGPNGPDELERHGYPRVSHSGASDCRRWWPACTDYSPGEPGLSDDAARYRPEVACAVPAASRPAGTT